MVVHKHSKAYREFQKSAIRNQAVIRLLAGFMMNTDTLVKHLQNSETDPQALQLGKTLLDDLAFFEEHVSWEQFDQMMAELFICRCVDAFLTYLPQVLLSAFMERPELFKGYFNQTGKKGEAEKKVNMREVLDYLLRYDNTRDVIQQLAQDQVEELGHKGLSAIIDDLNSRFGLGFDTKLLEYKSSCELVEI